MSTLKVEEKICLAAPVGRVWRFLLDPAAVAACLPGARLDTVEDERNFTGTMKIKVGIVTTEFRGKASFTEVVPEEHRVRLLASGDDKGGAGSAKMVMSSSIVPLENGGSELRVTADVEMAGKLVRFGRGMMEGIGKQMFKQFAERVQRHLAEAAQPHPLPLPLPLPSPSPSASPIASVKPLALVAAVSDTSTAVAAVSPGASAATVTATATATVTAQRAEIVVKDDVLDAGGLVWRALWEWVKGLVRRLFGRG